MGEQMNILKIRTVIVNTSKTSQDPIVLSFVPPHGIKLPPKSARTIEGHLETFLLEKPSALRALQRLLKDGEIRLDYKRVLPDGTAVPLLQADNAAASTVEPPTVQPAHDEGAGVTATPAPSNIPEALEAKWELDEGQELSQIHELPVPQVDGDANIVTPDEVIPVEPDVDPIEALLEEPATEVPAEPVVEAPKKRKGRPRKQEVASTPVEAQATEDVLSADTL